MKVIPLGKRALNSLSTDGTKQVYEVEGKKGLRTEITPAGRFCFRFQTRFNGKPQKFTLKSESGEILRWGENVHTVAPVEAAYDDLRIKLRNGINPNTQDRLSRESMTIAELYDSYCIHFKHRIDAGEVRESSYKAANSMWRNHIVNLIGGEKALEFTDKQASVFAAQLLSSNGYASHNKVVKLLKAMFNYGMNTLRALDGNPFKGVKLLSEPKRERRLTQGELERLRASMSVEDQIYQDVILMLILTGQRKSCVYSMEWSEINRDQAVWYIPTSKMKANKAHAVPLTPTVMEVLDRRAVEAVPNERFVFPSNRSKTGHIAEKAGKGSFWRRVIERAGLYSSNKAENLCVHDLRRSLASFNVERGASIQSVSKLLGHSDISITASTYAHLNTDTVRDELVETERLILAPSSKLEVLRDQILALSDKDREQLMGMVSDD